MISRLLLNTVEGISKPALAALWPNEKSMNVVLDLGANIECSEKNLIDFSEMGAALYQSLYPNDKAKVALLNICLLYTSPSPRDATLSRMAACA